MTYMFQNLAPSIDSSFLVPISGSCCANFVPDSSGTEFQHRLEHCSIPSQKVACTWLKWWLVTGRWLLLTFSCVMKLLHAVLFVYVSNILSQKFSFQTHTEWKNDAKNQCQKMDSIYGAGLWSVSWVFSLPVSHFTSLWRLSVSDLTHTEGIWLKHQQYSSCCWMLLRLKYTTHHKWAEFIGYFGDNHHSQSLDRSKICTVWT